MYLFIRILIYQESISLSVCVFIYLFTHNLHSAFFSSGTKTKIQDLSRIQRVELEFVGELRSIKVIHYYYYFKKYIIIIIIIINNNNNIRSEA